MLILHDFSIKTCAKTFFLVLHVFILWLFMAEGKGFHTLLFLRDHPICAGHPTALIRWATVCLSVIVRTASLIRPSVTWLAAVPSKHNDPPYYIYFSATLLVRGGALAATVKLFEIMSNWDLLFITTSAQ